MIRRFLRPWTAAAVLALGLVGYGAAQVAPGATTYVMLLAGSAVNATLQAGSNTIGSIANISGTISLPTGAATSANQSRSLTYVDAGAAALAANATVTSTIRTAPAYLAKFNAIAYAGQASTITVQGCQDSACSVNAPVSTASVTAGTWTAPPAVNVVFPYYRTSITNTTATATTYYLDTSFTAN